jgi:hypothetical protein
MKKIVFLSFFVLICITSIHAQKRYLWLDAGGKILAGGSFMYNSDIVEDSQYNPLLSLAYGGGGKFGINFKEYHGITFDGLYSFANQKYTYKTDPEGELLSNEVKWSNFDLAVLYRYTRSINYIELGPQLSFGRTAYQANNQSNFDNISDHVNSPYLSAIFGFGYMAVNSDAFTTMLGFRFAYGVDDFLNDSGKAANIITNPVQFEDKTQHPVSVQLVLEFNWGIGYYARTVCTGRRSFFRF